MSRTHRPAPATLTRQPLNWTGPMPEVHPIPVELDPGHPTAAQSSFVPEATRAAWDGETLVVQFREAGLPAGATTTVSVIGEGSTDAVAVRDTSVVYSLHSEAAVTTQTHCPVSDDGTIDHTFLLHLATRVALPGQPATRTTVRRTFFATIRDLDTGAVAYLSGDASPEQLAS